MLRHEIPTHLDVPDHFVAGLTMKQVLQLVGGASSAYSLVGPDSLLPAGDARVVAAAIVLILALAAAFVRPGGWALEEWSLLLLAHLAMPHRMVWRPRTISGEPPEAGWAGFSPRPGWSPGQGGGERAGYA